ncbi:MAG: hypothetical protein PHQ11_02175 [Paludibacter sp.]|nr:hypothetical protein [Paludibacter sp.]MDD4427344.1 hypothetical protein [Paludibacter sp.]
MKKFKSIKAVVIAGFLAIAMFATAQIGLSSGKNFEFKNGVEEWSEPISVNLKAYKGEASIPVSIRVKYGKKVILACHYLIEITNLSETKSAKFKVGTGYTDYKGNDVVESFSLKPKATVEGKIIYASGTKKPKGADDCINYWSPSLQFFETKIR